MGRYLKLGHGIGSENVIIRNSIRLNTLKSSENALVAQLKRSKVRLDKIPFLENAYWAEADFALSSTPGYLHGHFYIQEAASQLPAVVLSPQKSDIVLDMCAAPGSKTTQLAQLMENKGTIIALDSNPARLIAVKNNLERCGVSNCIAYHKDALHASDLETKFDRILLDAPCSGNFTTDAEWFEKRSIEGVKQMAKTQKALIKQASLLLRPEGTLVYSTCSLEPEENEEVIEWAVDNLKLKLVDTGLKIGQPGTTKKTALCKRFWPDTEGTQGFFIAKLMPK